MIKKVTTMAMVDLLPLPSFSGNIQNYSIIVHQSLTIEFLYLYILS